MRFGLFYEHQLPRPWAEGDEEQLLNDALDQIELADRIGVDYVWEVEHHFLEEYSHSSAPEVFLAAATQRTQNIRIGHGIVQLPVQFNHAARVAERIATLDLLSGGRVEFGTGEGSSQVELGGFGVPRSAKRGQWQESIDVVTRMLAEEPFAGHRGDWIDVPPRNVVPKPKQKPHPPLWVACSRRETIELAARNGLGALSFSFVEPEDAKPWVESYYSIIDSEECVPAGLDVNPNFAVVVPFMCHKDEATAIERGIDGAHFFGYSLAYYYVFGRHRPGYSNVWEDFEASRHEQGFARDLVRAEAKPLDVKVLEGAVGSLRGAIGTPEQIADLVGRYQDVGVDQVIFVAQAGRNRHEHICEALDLFGSDVLPRFADGREEGDAQKRERLAPAIERALARKPAPKVTASPEHYVVTTEGEAAAGRVPTFGGLSPRDLAPRRMIEWGVQTAVGGVLGIVPGPVTEAVATSPGALLLYRRGMERLFDRSKLEGMDGVLQFELTTDGKSHAWTLDVRDGEVSTHSGPSERADAVVRISAGDFVAIVSGALGAGEALFDGRIALEGDEAVVLRTFGAVAGRGFY